jgi:hypothetical protein
VVALVEGDGLFGPV